MVYCDDRTGCFIKTIFKHSVCRFWSWISYVLSKVFLQRCHRCSQTSDGVHLCDRSKMSGFYSSYMCMYKPLPNSINKCTFQSLGAWNLTSFFHMSLAALFLDFWALDSLSWYQCTLLYFCKPPFKMGLCYVSSLFFNSSHFQLIYFHFILLILDPWSPILDAQSWILDPCFQDTGLPYNIILWPDQKYVKI